MATANLASPSSSTMALRKGYWVEGDVLSVEEEEKEESGHLTGAKGRKAPLIDPA